MLHAELNYLVAEPSAIQALTFDEIDSVSGGDRGDATAGGAVTGAATAAAAMMTARYASYGARIGVFGGVAGIIGGAIVGGAIGYAAYSIGSTGMGNQNSTDPNLRKAAP